MTPNSLHYWHKYTEILLMYISSPILSHSARSYSIPDLWGNMTKLTTLSSEIPLHISMKCSQLSFTAKKPMLNKSSPFGNTQQTRLQPKHSCLWNILHSYYIKHAKQTQMLVLMRLHDISLKSVARTHYTIASASNLISFMLNYSTGTQW